MVRLFARSEDRKTDATEKRDLWFVVRDHLDHTGNWTEIEVQGRLASAERVTVGMVWQVKQCLNLKDEMILHLERIERED